MENITRTAQETIGKLPQIAQDTTNNLGKAVQNVVDSLGPVMDRLAGTQSNVTLRFNDLTFDNGTSRARISGAINLEVSYINDKQKTSTSKSPTVGDSDKVDFGQVDQTVVTNVE